MTEADPMSPAQREAMQKAWDLLTEHFERVLLVIDFEVEGEDGKRQDAHQGFWHGGALASVGMAEYAKDRIMSCRERDNEPDDEDE